MIQLQLWLSDQQLAAGVHIDIQRRLRQGAYADCPGCWEFVGREVSPGRYRGSNCRLVTLTLEPIDGIARAKAEHVTKEARLHALRTTN